MKSSWWPPPLKIFPRPEDQPSPHKLTPVLSDVSQRLFILQVSFANELATLEIVSIPLQWQPLESAMMLSPSLQDTRSLTDVIRG